MPDRRTHEDVGFVVGGCAAALHARAEASSHALAETLGGCLGGWLGGIMPDVFEPATSPSHRSVAHSVIVLTSLALARTADAQTRCRTQAKECESRAVLLAAGTSERLVAEWEALFWRIIAGFLIGFVAGYSSHLLLDAATARGLPIVGAGI